MATGLLGVTENLTPSDSSGDDVRFDYFMVTGATGTVRIILRGGEVDLVDVPVGVWIPMSTGVRISATGTTATGFMGY